SGQYSELCRVNDIEDLRKGEEPCDGRRPRCRDLVRRAESILQVVAREPQTRFVNIHQHAGARFVIAEEGGDRDEHGSVEAVCKIHRWDLSNSLVETARLHPELLMQKLSQACCDHGSAPAAMPADPRIASSSRNGDISPRATRRGRISHSDP